MVGIQGLGEEVEEVVVEEEVSLGLIESRLARVLVRIAERKGEV